MQAQHLLTRVNALVKEWHALPASLKSELIDQLDDRELALLCASSSEFEYFCQQALERRRSVAPWLSESSQIKRTSPRSQYELLRARALQTTPKTHWQDYETF
jgi:hypothetical protein